MHPKVELGPGISSFPWPGPGPPCPSWSRWAPPRASQPLQHRLEAQQASGSRGGPCSPSAGVMLTPIQIESFLQPNLPAAGSWRVPIRPGAQTPSCPALSIARTPVKTSCGEPPRPRVEELSEVFEIEAPRSNLPPEPVLPLEALCLLNWTCLWAPSFPWGTRLPPRSQIEQVFSKEETGQPVLRQALERPRDAQVFKL